MILRMSIPYVLLDTLQSKFHDSDIIISILPHQMSDVFSLSTSSRVDPVSLHSYGDYIPLGLFRQYIYTNIGRMCKQKGWDHTWEGYIHPWVCARKT